MFKKATREVTLEQIYAIRYLTTLLRRIGVIGLFTTSTSSGTITQKYPNPIRYDFSFIDYDPSYKGKFTSEEELDRIMSKIFDDRGNL